MAERPRIPPGGGARLAVAGLALAVLLPTGVLTAAAIRSVLTGTPLADPSAWGIPAWLLAAAALGPWLLAAGAVAAAIVMARRRRARLLDALGRLARRLDAGPEAQALADFDRAPPGIRALAAEIAALSDRLTEREAGLRDLVERQHRLMLEVNHRVKNNLQMVSSVINLQRRGLGGGTDADAAAGAPPDGPETAALQRVQDRIHALALVHQNIQTSRGLDRAELRALVRDVASHMAVSLRDRPVTLRVTGGVAAPPVTVDGAVATPVALFLTEAIAELVLARCPDGAPGDAVPGALEITLSASGPGFRLDVRETARRLDPGVLGQTLGIRLMDGFARQLTGRMALTTEQGRPVVSLIVAEPRRRSAGFRVRRGSNGGAGPAAREPMRAAAR